ncbi:MAG: hypothetical protein ACOZBL_03370 [Patescibacteria group bacterium]
MSSFGVAQVSLEVGVHTQDIEKSANTTLASLIGSDITTFSALIFQFDIPFSIVSTD